MDIWRDEIKWNFRQDDMNAAEKVSINLFLHTDSQYIPFQALAKKSVAMKVALYAGYSINKGNLPIYLSMRVI